MKYTHIVFSHSDGFQYRAKLLNGVLLFLCKRLGSYHDWKRIPNHLIPTVWKGTHETLQERPHQNNESHLHYTYGEKGVSHMQIHSVT